MSSKAIREALAALGVIASLLFVGFEIRQNTMVARASAYQAIGVATAATLTARRTTRSGWRLYRRRRTLWMRLIGHSLDCI